MKVKVRVPATSANMGPGFDSIGVALQLYNTVTVVQTDGEGVKIEIDEATKMSMPQDKRNLVYRAIKKVYDLAGRKCGGLHIILENNIPVTRGLGSSSAGTVGGLLAANRLCGDFLTRGELLKLACDIEGHPDNSTPAIVGGMAIAVRCGGIVYHKVEVDEESLRFALFVPNFKLRTKEARSAIPGYIPHRNAVFNAGRSALLVAAIAEGRYELLKTALEDRLHQPYRRRMIAGLDEIFARSRKLGAYGSYISGSGSALVSIVGSGSAEEFHREMKGFLEERMPDWGIDIRRPDNRGAEAVIIE